MYLLAAFDPGPLNYLKHLIPHLSNEFKLIINPNFQNILDPHLCNHLINIEDIPTYNFELCLCGTSLNQDFESKIIYKMPKATATISFIDHWSNFSKRFLYKNTLLYPDHIIVNNQKAIEIAANSQYPIERVHALGNPILEQLIQFKELNIKKNSKILFISEEVLVDNDAHNTYDEYFIMDILSRALTFGYTLDVKLHPAEVNINKYKKYPISNIFYEKNFDRFCEYEYIIGMNSFLLLELSILRKNVLSFSLGIRDDITHSGGVFSVKIETELFNILENHTEIQSSSKLAKNEYLGSNERIIDFLNSI